ncbi:hypothetical protein THIOKS1190004 [Thiocapsa sp. KS1]|nr:hypothetical protein THIOKS1190004 [Thiocapsa sp. KS1]
MEIARTVRRWTGIPVAVGIAPTKTLAKLANRLAKKGHGPVGPVLDWSALPDCDAVLAAVAVEDIWGIAGRSGARLRAIGIAMRWRCARRTRSGCARPSAWWSSASPGNCVGKSV